MALIKKRSARLADKTMQKRAPYSFRTIRAKNNSGSKFTRGKLSGRDFRPYSPNYKPYRKPNDDPLYIHNHSNHPPNILIFPVLQEEQCEQVDCHYYLKRRFVYCTVA